MKFTSKLHFFIITILILVAGTALGWTIKDRTDKDVIQYAQSIHAIRINDPDHNLISPLLAVDSSETDYKSDTNLSDKVQDLINNEAAQGAADKISVYYRSLKTGNWVDLNKDEKYNPASLLKVPLMIAYLREAQQDPGLLQKQITFTKEINQSAQIPFEQGTKLQYGTNYKVDDLLTDVITQSDNGAMDSLLSTVDQNILNETYTDLGITGPDNTTAYQISPKTYSLFFRILYNATYLNADMSQKALGLLSRATFKDGLVAGLPQNLTVAHKFGEHVNTDSTGTQQLSTELHDCGIVYAPNSPYILCVMTRGGDIKKLQNTISDISKLVYEQRKDK